MTYEEIKKLHNLCEDYATENTHDKFHQLRMFINDMYEEFVTQMMEEAEMENNMRRGE